MKNSLLVSLVILTSACGGHKTSDDVKQRIEQEKGSGAWDRRPEVALDNRLAYRQIGSCDSNSLGFNGVAIEVPATQTKPAYLVHAYLNANHSYKSLWYAAIADQPGHYDFSHNVTIEGLWNTTTTYGAMIHNIGTAQFDASMNVGTFTLVGGKNVTLPTDATSAKISIGSLDVDSEGKSAEDHCKNNSAN
jgi:hypothetical protein